MSHAMPTRRDFLIASTCLAAGAMSTARADGPRAETPVPAQEPFFRTRGVVLRPKDTLLTDWPELAKRAGLTTIASHPFPGTVIGLLKTVEGRRFFEQCREVGLQVEHELHAMGSLLPRKLFEKNPEMFRMDEKGNRIRAGNCCPSNPRALEIIAESAVEIAKALPSTTGRYFLWGDDMVGWCQCPKCRGFLPADQALMVVNRMGQALRRVSPNAQIAHLAYQSTLPPPRQIKPDEGVFLEFAPNRSHARSYESQRKPGDFNTIEALDANLEVFPKETAQVLEYWLDVGRFSGQARSKQPVKLPWNKDVFLADVESYRKRGIRHITTFATGVDPDYRALYGDLSFIDEYGAGLLQ